MEFQRCSEEQMNWNIIQQNNFVASTYICTGSNFLYNNKNTYRLHFSVDTYKLVFFYRYLTLFTFVYLNSVIFNLLVNYFFFYFFPNIHSVIATASATITGSAEEAKY